jgi:hypothetical protein
VCSFYLKLGFICHDEYVDDNGLSQTSKGFQKAVQKFPKLWVPPGREAMSFFQLFQGQLNLSQNEIDLTESDSKSETTWKSYAYAKFPWPSPSMKRIEGHLDTHPILRWLSGEPLPVMEHPFFITRSMSTMSGMIIGNAWQLLNSRSWLSTNEILFLFAFLLRNPESNRFFHVLGPTITNKVAIAYHTMAKIVHGNATDKDVISYNYMVKGIQDYIDSRLDIFEHKFLVFVCNQSQMHWVSVVVINPFLVFDQYLAEGKDDHGRHGAWGDEDFVGWCVFNSNTRQEEREQDGFQGTMYTKNKASYGVQLFLNICALYLKAKKKNEGDGRQQDSFHYEEPFGPFTESNGTEGFPQFDYDCP